MTSHPPEESEAALSTAAGDLVYHIGMYASPRGVGPSCWSELSIELVKIPVHVSGIYAIQT